MKILISPIPNPKQIHKFGIGEKQNCNKLPTLGPNSFWGWKGLCVWLLFLPLLVTAQPYSIDWFTLDGGGGTSTNGQFTVSGTIGQPDAGQMRGEHYSLTGGFWGIVSVIQTPGAPVLSIGLTASGDGVRISWPCTDPDWMLVWSSNLPPHEVIWHPVPHQSDETGCYYIAPLSSTPIFYQLYKP